MSERINPDEWGLEELVKHSYREIKEIRREAKEDRDRMEEQIQSLDVKVSELNDELNKRKGAYAVIAIVLGFASGLLTKIINIH